MCDHAYPVASAHRAEEWQQKRFSCSQSDCLYQNSARCSLTQSCSNPTSGMAHHVSPESRDHCLLFPVLDVLYLWSLDEDFGTHHANNAIMQCPDRQTPCISTLTVNSWLSDDCLMSDADILFVHDSQCHVTNPPKHLGNNCQQELIVGQATYPSYMYCKAINQPMNQSVSLFLAQASHETLITCTRWNNLTLALLSGCVREPTKLPERAVLLNQSYECYRDVEET